MLKSMKLLSAMSPEDARQIEVVFSDIDDTITTHGQLTDEAYSAMWRLREAGLALVPVTGRPAGWCDHIARMWPVAGIVGENGALYFSYERGARQMVEAHAFSASERSVYRSKLDNIRERVLKEIPGAGIASDQSYRLYDLAIDFCEDVPRLPDSDVERIVAIFEEEGAVAKVSSIHVNGWFGRYDKVMMMKRFARERLAMNLDEAPERLKALYIGDSPNDEPAFSFFEIAVGVANLAEHEKRLKHWPNFMTRSPQGAGFAEMVTTLLALRRGAS